MVAQQGGSTSLRYTVHLKKDEDGKFHVACISARLKKPDCVSTSMFVTLHFLKATLSRARCAATAPLGWNTSLTDSVYTPQDTCSRRPSRTHPK